jgi:hypothetical protein
VDEETAAERRERVVDPLQILDDVGAENDAAQMGDGVGGHGWFLVIVEEASRAICMEAMTWEVMADNAAVAAFAAAH